MTTQDRRAPVETSGGDAGPSGGCILTVNGGSSSLKFALFAPGDPPRRLSQGRIERVGQADSRLVVAGADGALVEAAGVRAPDQAAAAGLVIARLRDAGTLSGVAAVGHRVVHGGDRFVAPAVVTAAMLDALRRISPFDPDHLPGEIALIEAFRAAAPGVPQVACFDTAFHRDMPRVARIVPVPRRYEALGVRRYGFHGLSYAYLMEDLARVAGEGAARGRVVLAHLGSGASLAAVKGGRCLDTTMGFTPASGIVMGTRCGDIDAGLPAFLAAAEGMTPERFQHMANHESGLLGVSETSADMRDLEARRGTDPRAAEAVDLFCYHVRKAVGALAAALGGLDTLVFSGGIGENAPEVRRAVCEGLEFLGVRLDPAANAAAAPLISADPGAAAVRVIRTDEEAMIAREAARVAWRAT
jgi:acetate kinase